VLQVRVSAMIEGLLIFYLQNAVLSAAIYPSRNSKLPRLLYLSYSVMAVQSRLCNSPRTPVSPRTSVRRSLTYCQHLVYQFCECPSAPKRSLLSSQLVGFLYTLSYAAPGPALALVRGVVVLSMVVDPEVKANVEEDWVDLVKLEEVVGAQDVGR
jgi:hypothetical protein